MALINRGTSVTAIRKSTSVNSLINHGFCEEDSQSSNHISTCYDDSTCTTINRVSNKTTKLRRNIMFGVLIVTKFLGITGNSVLIPFYPQVASARGFSDFHIGMVFSVFELAVFILSPIFGTYIEKLGPKFLCVAGSFLCSGCCLLFGFLDQITNEWFLIMSLIVRLVNGASDAMLTCGDDAILLHSSPKSVGKIMGFLEMSEGAAQIAGPALGTALYLAGGYLLPFAVLSGMLMVCSLLLIFVIPSEVCQDGESAVSGSEVSRKSALHILKIPGVVINFIICVSVPLAISSLFPVLGNWMINKFACITTTEVGIVFIAWSGAYAVLSPFIGWISDKGYIYSLTMASLLGLAAMFSIIGPYPLLSDSLFSDQLVGLVIISLVGMGIFGAGANIPPYQACLNLAHMNGYKEDLNTIGIVAGLLESAFCLGTFAGTLLSGLITDRLGFEWSATVMMSVVLSVVFILGCFLLYMKISGKPLAPESRSDADNDERQKLINDVADYQSTADTT